MMALEGGSFGFQIGGQDTDFVLLVMNESGARGILSGKVKLGGDASVATGPVGRDASAETDVTLRSEILSYSRSRGLFAGISLESGKAMARTGLRMMPTFPSSPLRFRTAGFPRYGSKAGLSDGACPCGAAIASLGLRPSFVSSAALNTPRAVSRFLAQHNTAVRAV